MLSEWELWACANEYIRQYSDRAADLAAEREADLALKGDDEGASAWRLIQERIKQLQASPVSVRH